MPSLSLDAAELAELQFLSDWLRSDPGVTRHSS